MPLLPVYHVLLRNKIELLWPLLDRILYFLSSRTLLNAWSSYFSFNTFSCICFPLLSPFSLLNITRLWLRLFKLNMPAIHFTIFLIQSSFSEMHLVQYCFCLSHSFFHHAVILKKWYPTFTLGPLIKKCFTLLAVHSGGH